MKTFTLLSYDKSTILRLERGEPSSELIIYRLLDSNNNIILEYRISNEECEIVFPTDANIKLQEDLQLHYKTYMHEYLRVMLNAVSAIEDNFDDGYELHDNTKAKRL